MWKANTGEVIFLKVHIPDSKIHGANMGPIWSRRDPGGPHVGPMNFAIWDVIFQTVPRIGSYRLPSIPRKQF